MTKSSKGPPRPVRIVEIDEKNQQFVLNEEALRAVLHNVPENMKISVVSVVGAFRTGKSFLLDFFLKYLRATGSSVPNLDGEPDQSWLAADASRTLEGNVSYSKGEQDKHAKGGFGWRSGRERCTTGIWMWSEYFKREIPPSPDEDGNFSSNGKPETVAVLLVDTQGMFDSSLGQMLTASIFGLSTLISSYQIYNLDKRVQEDNLQHLALFTEYGRVALQYEKKQRDLQGREGAEHEDHGEDFGEEDSEATAPRKESKWTVSSRGDGEHTGNVNTPFQRVEFLVRDWQNFENEDAKMSKLINDMQVYLDEVLDSNNKTHKDLTQVREHIQSCFETVSCFLLPHPGKGVTKPEYDGDLSDVDPSFKRLLSEYVRRVFSSRLACKRIHGHNVNSRQLFIFIKSYCELFRKADIFPEAKTLLAATSEANNRAAVDSAVKLYRKIMDPWAGPQARHIEESKLQEVHREANSRARAKFATIATMGAATDIKQFETELKLAIEERYRDYKEANELRDPYAFVQPFIIPLMIAAVMYLIRSFLDLTCAPYSSTCATGSDFTGTVYVTIFTFILFHGIARTHGIKLRVSKMLGVSGMEGGL